MRGPPKAGQQHSKFRAQPFLPSIASFLIPGTLSFPNSASANHLPSSSTPVWQVSAELTSIYIHVTLA